MAARNWDWWYNQAPEGLLMSVSQYKLAGGCLRRWGFRHMLKLREEMGPAAGEGDKYHHELEMWVKLRKLPVSKPALAGLRYAPAPGCAEAEVPVCYMVDGAPWIGFIDLVYDWEGPIGLGNGGIKPLTSTGHTVIHDWKFTGNISGDHVLTEEGLLEDEAANLYALEAYMGGAQLVSCRWVYVQMKGSPTAKEVWVEMPLEGVIKRLQGMSARTTELHQIVKLHRKDDPRTLNTAVLGLEQDIGECFAFRRNCPYKPNTEHTHERIRSGEIEGCCPTSRLSMPAPKGESNMQDFKTAMASFPGGGVKTPPALPPKKAPALPPKKPVEPTAPAELQAARDADPTSDDEAARMVEEHLRAQGKTADYHNNPKPVVERGFVNSNAAPENPPASPEEAAAVQGVTKDEGPAPIVDDLTPLSKDQLRALCGLEGVDLAKKRPAEETLRAMLRAARIQRAAGSTVKTVVAPVEMQVDTAYGSVQVTEDAIREAVKKAPALPPKVEAEQRTWAAAVMELHTIMNRAHEKLFEDTGKRDYRHIQYTGSADLCLSVQDLFESGGLVAEVVVFDSRTPEGSTLKTTLLDLARAGRFLLIDGQRL